METVRDRFRGALLGLAIGDALGAPHEFVPRDAAPPITGMHGGGKFELAPGMWTDDTSMALCLASSLIETGTFDMRDQLTRFLRWRDEGYHSSTGRCFGIGRQTFWALDEFARSGSIARSATRTNASGNGSLMRLAPVAMAFAHDLELVSATSVASSLTTHPAVECLEACSAYGRLVAGALQGWNKSRILAECALFAENLSCPSVRAVLNGGFLNKSRAEIFSSGYVVDTMEASLWAFAHHESFEAGALAAVNLGNDSDTVGAVYGQLAGAFYGHRGIPTAWSGTLHEARMIIGMADDLFALAPRATITSESAEHVTDPHGCRTEH